jgi:hypothetical protein
MSANAFGGHNRIDKLDLSGPSLIGGVLRDVTSIIRPERLLWLSTLQTAWDHLDFPLALDEFCARLMEERRRLLASNWAHVARFLGLPGRERALVCPETPEDVEELHECRAARKAVFLREAA